MYNVTKIGQDVTVESQSIVLSKLKNTHSGYGLQRDFASTGLRLSTAMHYGGSNVYAKETLCKLPEVLVQLHACRGGGYLRIKKYAFVQYFSADSSFYRICIIFDRDCSCCLLSGSLLIRMCLRWVTKDGKGYVVSFNPYLIKTNRNIEFRSVNRLILLSLLKSIFHLKSIRDKSLHRTCPHLKYSSQSIFSMQAVSFGRKFKSGLDAQL